MSLHEAWFAPTGGMTKVQGFISPRAARAISAILTHQQDRKLVGSLAEIGAFCGKTMVGMALAGNPGERVIGIDIFPDDMAQRLFNTLKMALPVETGAKVQLVKIDSTTLEPIDWMKLLAQPARFVHIDGDHTYNAVLSDLQLAGSYLAAEAVVVIDDFLHDWYPDVTEGVLNGLRVAKNLRPVAVIPRSGSLMNGGTKLICATPGAVDDYLALMKATFPELKGNSVRIAGHPAFAFFNYD